MKFNAVTLTISFLLVLIVSACSSVSEQRSAPVAQPKPASAPVAPAEIQMEGGIVGTGNEDECKKSDNKVNCNDNVK